MSQGDSNPQTTTLKPCPFCGGTRLSMCETVFQDREAYAVTCCTSECHGGVFSLGYGNFPSRELAAARWNERAPT